jgi:DNA-3-methyladenine glycosylase
VSPARLARGPGCLGQALGLGSGENGADLLGGGRVQLLPPATGEAPPVSSGHRVGVSVAHDVPWRFWITDDPTVSAYKRSPRAR